MRSYSLWFVFSISLLFAATVLASPNEYVKPTTDLIIQKDKIFDPNTLSFDSAQTYEKNFNFDGNQYVLLEEHKQKIDAVETFIKKHDANEYQQLSQADQNALGKIFYKLGSFYLRSLRQPDQAIQKFNLALDLLKNNDDRTWATNYLAYAYEQKYAALDDDADKDKALSYSNKIISQNAKANTKEVAFAYYVKGLTERAAAKYADAETSLGKAAEIYHKIPGGKDDQYVIVKTSLAEIILIRDGRDGEALNLLQQAQKYWHDKQANETPYVAKNLLALAEVNLRLGYTKVALDQYKKALNMLQKLYGNKSEWLVEPYQQLSDAYKKLGDQKLASVYEQKADALNKG